MGCVPGPGRTIIQSSTLTLQDQAAYASGSTARPAFKTSTTPDQTRIPPLLSILRIAFLPLSLPPSLIFFPLLLLLLQSALLPHSLFVGDHMSNWNNAGALCMSCILYGSGPSINSFFNLHHATSRFTVVFDVLAFLSSLATHSSPAPRSHVNVNANFVIATATALDMFGDPLGFTSMFCCGHILTVTSISSL